MPYTPIEDCTCRECKEAHLAMKDKTANFYSVEQRYMHDVRFHNFVDTLVHYMEQLSTTPTEIREAAMLAQIIFENRHNRLLNQNALSELRILPQ